MSFTIRNIQTYIEAGLRHFFFFTAGMSSPKNILRSLGLGLIAAHSASAIPVHQRSLKSCLPGGSQCSDGEVCASGDSAASAGTFGVAAFFCQPADKASKRALKPCSPEGNECGTGEVCLSGDAGSSSSNFGIAAFSCQPIDDADDVDEGNLDKTPQKRFKPHLCSEEGTCPGDLICKNKVLNDPMTGSTIGPLNVCVSADDAAATQKRFTPYLCPENGCPDDMECKNQKVKDPTTGTLIGPLDVCVSV